MDQGTDTVTPSAPSSNALTSNSGNDVKQETGVRDHLISTAVKFLQNPKVKATPLGKKQEFLKKKGLTENEIELACQAAGVYNETVIDIPGSKNVTNYQTPAARTSLLLKAMDVANMIALISIGSYSLYSLWKNYIAPWLFGTRSRLEQNYERLLQSITKLNENVVELRELLREMQLLSNSSAKSSMEFQDVKKEIQAIKSLLLGRSQFPSPSSMASTGIPSWQLVEHADNSNDNSDENSSRKSRKANKSEHKERKEPEDSQSERGDEEIPSASGIRKHPSLDSNNGFNSSSSCEVVYMGKGHDSSDPDHSE